MIPHSFLKILLNWLADKLESKAFENKDVLSANNWASDSKPSGRSLIQSKIEKDLKYILVEDLLLWVTSLQFDCEIHSFHLINNPFMSNLIKSLWDVKNTKIHFKWRVLVKTSIYIANNWQYLIPTRITLLKSRLIYIKQFIFFNKLKNRIKNNSFKYFTAAWKKWEKHLTHGLVLKIFCFAINCLKESYTRKIS